MRARSRDASAVGGREPALPARGPRPCCDLLASAAVHPPEPVRRWPPRLGRHAGGIVATGVVLLAAAAVLGSSELTGPTFAELPRLAAVERGQDLIWSVVESGPGALGSSRARAAYRAFGDVSVLPVLVGSWATLGIAKTGWLDALSAARMGWLIAAMLGPLGVYWIGRRARGMRQGALGAVLLLALPRWLHGSATASDSVVVAALSMFVLGAYVRSIPRRRDRGPPDGSICAAPLGALALGLALAISSSVLWVVPVILAHSIARGTPAIARVLRQGRFPVPAVFLWALVVTVPVMVLLHPDLWRTSPAGLVRWALSPIGEDVTATLYRGSMVTGPAVPRTYAADWIVSTTPLPALVLAVVGAARLAAVWRRSGSGRRDSGLGVLCLCGLGWAVLWPVVAPPLLTLFPPRAEIALPFVALLAAEGLEAVGRQIPARFRDVAVGAVAALMAWTSLGGVRTSGAEFSVLAGTTARVAREHSFAVRDGSEVAVLAPDLDALGQPKLRVDGPVPRQYWDVLERSGRLQTRIDVAGRRARADVVLTEGDQVDAFAVVSHGGVTLWSAARTE